MSEMAFGALLSRANFMEAFSKERMEPLLGGRFKGWPDFFDITLQFGKELFNGVEIW